MGGRVVYILCLISFSSRGEGRRSVSGAAEARLSHHIRQTDVSAEQCWRCTTPLPNLHLQLLSGLAQRAAGPSALRTPAQRRLLQVLRHSPTCRWKLRCVARRSRVIGSVPNHREHRQLHSQAVSNSAVLNSSPRAPPLCIFLMLLLSLQMFVLFERKCPAKWTSQDIPPWFQFEANVYIPFKVHWSVQDVN